MKNLEDKMQHELVMWFSQTWPDVQNQLLMIQNTTYSKAHGNRMKAMGLRKSAPDLILLCDYVAGIELKAPGSVHKKSHVISQLQFGKDNFINKDRYFLMSSDIEVCKEFASALMIGVRGSAIDIMERELEKIENLIHISASVVRF